MDKLIRNTTAEFLIFTSQSGENSIEVKVFDESVWLIQTMIAQLFDTTKQKMTNTSLRERFGIDAKNTSMVSRIIKDTLDDEQIFIYDESVGAKARKYIPWWAK